MTEEQGGTLQPAPRTTRPAKPPAGLPTGFVYGDVYLKHLTGEGHPERPDRLTSIVQGLEESRLLEKLVRLQPRAVEQEWLTAVHSTDYVRHVRTVCSNAPSYLDTGDTPVCNESYEAALAAAGGVLAAVDAVVEQRVRNAFCAVRPPGHHASAGRGMGFCLFNNVAIAARYAQRKHKCGKVLIVDWDVHHGNGTQAIFYEDPSVLYFSVHQDHFYPFTGGAAERGTGKALGCTINVPLEAGRSDREYKAAFHEVLRPAAARFRPEFVLVSAGFDAYEHDLLGRMKVTRQGFAELTRIVMVIAHEYCGDRLVAVLEGGYHLKGLAECVEAHVRTLAAVI